MDEETEAQPLCRGYEPVVKKSHAVGEPERKQTRRARIDPENAVHETRAAEPVDTGKRIGDEHDLSPKKFQPPDGLRGVEHVGEDDRVCGSLPVEDAREPKGQKRKDAVIGRVGNEDVPESIDLEVRLGCFRPGLTFGARSEDDHVVAESSQAVCRFVGSDIPPMRLEEIRGDEKDLHQDGISRRLTAETRRR